MSNNNLQTNGDDASSDRKYCLKVQGSKEKHAKHIAKILNHKVKQLKKTIKSLKSSGKIGATSGKIGAASGKIGG
jgi:hypothetical protein